jgi:hypothetical protein
MARARTPARIQTGGRVPPRTTTPPRRARDEPEEVADEPESEQPDEEEEDTSNMIIRFPADKKEASKFNRDGFLGNSADGRFIHKASSDEATAVKISARLHNGHLRGKATFKRKFPDEFRKWASGEPFVNKKSRVSYVVYEYSRFLSTRMTKLRKEWEKHAQGDPGGSGLWDDFVQLTRVTFENKINVLATKPTGEFKSWDKVMNDLKENHQVSFVFYYYLH